MSKLNQTITGIALFTFMCINTALAEGGGGGGGVGGAGGSGPEPSLWMTLCIVACVLGLGVLKTRKSDQTNISKDQ